MKTSILRTVCFAVVIFLTNAVVIKAQEPFYDRSWDAEGRILSSAKYVMGYFGMSIVESVSKSTYDENGDLLKKEVFVWKPKYEFNSKRGRWEPDYSESTWKPQYCIQHSKDMVNNFVTIELLLWNKKTNAYDSPAESMIFQEKDANHFNYLAFTKGKKYDEIVNNIDYDKKLLAKLVE
jgi:hypothetical protein